MKIYPKHNDNWLQSVYKYSTVCFMNFNIGMIQKQVHWISNEFNDRKIEHHKTIWDMLFERKKPFLCQIVTTHEKWIYPKSEFRILKAKNIGYN